MYRGDSKPAAVPLLHDSVFAWCYNCGDLGVVSTAFFRIQLRRI